MNIPGTSSISSSNKRHHNNNNNSNNNIPILNVEELSPPTEQQQQQQQQNCYYYYYYSLQKTPSLANMQKSTNDDNITLPQMPVQFLSHDSFSHKTSARLNNNSNNNKNDNNNSSNSNSNSNNNSLTTTVVKTTSMAISTDVLRAQQEESQAEAKQQKEPQPVSQKKPKLSFKERQRLAEEKRQEACKEPEAKRPPPPCSFTQLTYSVNHPRPRSLMNINTDSNSRRESFKTKEDETLSLQSPSVKSQHDTMRISFKDLQRYGIARSPPHHVGPLWQQQEKEKEKEKERGRNLSTSPPQLKDMQSQSQLQHVKHKEKPVELLHMNTTAENTSSSFSSTWPPSRTGSSVTSSPPNELPHRKKKDDTHHSYNQKGKGKEEKEDYDYSRQKYNHVPRELTKMKRLQHGSCHNKSGNTNKFVVTSGKREGEGQVNNTPRSTSDTGLSTFIRTGVKKSTQSKNKNSDIGNPSGSSNRNNRKNKNNKNKNGTQYGGDASPRKITTTKSAKTTKTAVTTTKSLSPMRVDNELLRPVIPVLMPINSARRLSPLTSPASAKAKDDSKQESTKRTISSARYVKDKGESRRIPSPPRERIDVHQQQRQQQQQQQQQQQESSDSLISPPPLLNATTSFHHGTSTIDSTGQDNNDVSRNFPSQSPPSLMNTTGSTYTGIHTSNERRERDKMLKRPSGGGTMLSTATTGIFSPMPISAEMSKTTSTLVGNFKLLSNRAESGQYPSMLFSPASHLEGSLPFAQTPDTPSNFAVTREHRRKSSFSSLYFSMTKRHKLQHFNTLTTNPSQAMMDEDTSREVRGDSGPDELLEMDCNDSFEGSPDKIGLIETEEHVFIPRYELLEDGKTAFESSVIRIRAANRSARSKRKGPESSNEEACMRSSPLRQRGRSKKGSKTNRKSKKRATRYNDNENGDRGDIDNNDNDDKDNNNNNDEDDDDDDVETDGFVFGSVSAAYTTDPEEEDPNVDCKIAARLIFNADNGVVIISGREEVGKYINPPPQDGDNYSNVVSQTNDEEKDNSRCTCSMEFITRHSKGFDYTKHHAHKLYHHCADCNRRPAAFLCLHCLKSTCPSHVTKHYQECKEHCTLFLNQLDIMTSFDRIFWCEKCNCFTWKYTEIYDPLVDHLAYTRGTYLDEAVRDISCVGYNVLLKKPQQLGRYSSLHLSPGREIGWLSISASPNIIVSLSPSVAASPMLLPLDAGNERVIGALNSNDTQNNANNNNNNNNNSNNNNNTNSNNNKKNTTAVEQNSHTGGCSASPRRRPFTRDVANLLNENNVLCVGEAAPRLVSLGAKVQGWRSTQEDAEAAFVIDIPAFTSTSETAAEEEKKEDDDDDDDDGLPETIAMAVFCVFDGHGGDAVAKLAASQFESHLRKAVASGRHDNEQARSLLLQLELESSSQVISIGERSPTGARESITHRQVNHNEGNNDNNNNNNIFESNATEVVLTAEAVRRHIENTASISSSTTSLSPTDQSTALGGGVAERNVIYTAAGGVVNSGSPLLTAAAAGGINGVSGIMTGGVSGTGSPLVSRQEMEMLRAYFAGIMEEALLSLDAALRQSVEGLRGDYHSTGCTACVVGITANFILCANLGDSGAAVYTPTAIRRISTTHRVADAVEANRIHAAGYRLQGGRIEGRLAVPRALGDYDFKQSGGRGPTEQAVVAVPDVTITPVPTAGEAARWGVIVACDGVWDSATLHQVHHAIVNAQSDIDVAGSAMEAVVRAREMAAGMRDTQKTTTTKEEEGIGAKKIKGEMGGEAASVDALLLASAAGIFAQCVAPSDNEEGIGMDNCSVILIERRA